MCRLFGIVVPDLRPLTHEVRKSIKADKSDLIKTFAKLSNHNPDGSGIAFLGKDSHVRVRKSPQKALSDRKFFRAAAKDAQAMIAHLRAATFARSSEVNAHPFLMGDMALAHNGAFFELEKIEAAISDVHLKEMKGHTDSERFLGLVATKFDEKIAAGAGASEARTGALIDAARYIGDTVPTYSVNALMVNTDGVRALKLPDTNGLWMRRTAIEDARRGTRTLVRDDEPGITVFSSSRLDAKDGWTELRSGELIHAQLDGTIKRGMTAGVLERQITIGQVGELAEGEKVRLGSGFAGSTDGNTDY